MDTIEETDMETDQQEEQTQAETSATKPSTYLPGQPLEEGEELVYDPTAYIMLHQAHPGTPCLSFDVKPNETDSQEYPLSTYVIAGTQSGKSNKNNVLVIKMTNLHKTNDKPESDEDSDDDESEEEDEDKLPKMSCAMVKHVGSINRIRTTEIQSANLVATWSDSKKVHIYDISQQLNAVNDPEILKQYIKNEVGTKVKPLFTFSGHQQEGFAMDWSSVTPGALATGDCRKDIHLWMPTGDGSWQIDQRPLIGHKDSVEDLQWSPTEANVLASCSVDKSIRIWDTRAKPNQACQLTAEEAHDSDVNVIHWNRNEPFIISGGDDNIIRIWDLRRFNAKTPVATFKHHSAPVTTVEWHPTDSSVFASGGADNQIALWDLSVERDEENTNEANSEIEQQLPPQLLFIHQGQVDIKELHWHPQMTGVVLSTAHSGFNIFKTISV